MKLSHSAGVTGKGDVLFRTPFGYMFRDAAETAECLLTHSDKTIQGLHSLGLAMADPGTQADPRVELDSGVPAIFTYLGQFIDHDITARTDREEADGGSSISDGDGNARADLAPATPEQIVARVFNARRPQLDLDSVYGDGPSLIQATSDPDLVATRADHFYEDMRLKVAFGPHGYLDVPRDAEGVAQIGDGRNDENVMVSQFHAAMLRFNNVVFDGLHGSSVQSRYIQARRLVRWAYQYIVANDFLKAVCDPTVVEDTLVNGPRFYSPAANGGSVFMPLEFSVAGFRFAHSMIRPFYKLNDEVTKDINDLLEPPRDRGTDSLLGHGRKLKPDNVIAWRNFVDLRADVFGGPQHTRLIDPRLALGLFDLRLGAPADTMMSRLTQRNLLRGYRFSIPTGQAVAAQMGIRPMAPEEVVGDDPKIAQAIVEGEFQQRTPLWYYVLQEAVVHTGGKTLGAVGSRLVAETLIGLLKADPNSYLNNLHHPAVTDKGIAVAHGSGSSVIGSVADIVRFAGLRK